MAFLVEYTEPEWRNLNMRSLKVDQAYIQLQSFYNKTTYLYSLSESCYTCPFSKDKVLPAFLDDDEQQSPTTEALAYDVARGLKLLILDKDNGPYAAGNKSVCLFELANLHEFGVYNLTVAGNGSCSLQTDKEGVSVNYAFLSVFLVVAILLLALKCGYSLWWRCILTRNSTLLNPSNSSSTIATNSNKKSKRMKSLDAFRGLAIVLMIFVNSGGGKYWWMEHAIWNGLHVADVVFPFFLWIMGVCMPISIKAQLARGESKPSILRGIIWRSIKLFLIGLCLNSLNGPEFNNLRIMGVLQRFGIAYLVCGLVHTLFFKVEGEYSSPSMSWLADIRSMKLDFLVVLSLLIIYFQITFGLHVPGCPKGYLGPGGKHDFARHPNCTMGGAAGYVDYKVLGPNHMYQYPTAKKVYKSTVFDPEGLLGCVLTIVHVFFGIMAGGIILRYPEWQKRLKRWICWSIVLGLIGGSLAGFSRESGWIPVNKNLWSLSFVLVTVSLAFLIFSLMYFVIDVSEWWSGYPFVEAGMNSIVLYVGHTIMHKMLPWHWRIGAMNTHFILLLEATWNTLLWLVVALYFDSIHCYYSL